MAEFLTAAKAKQGEMVQTGGSPNSVDNLVALEIEKTSGTARFSAVHCVAFALHAGYLGLDSFCAAAVDDAEVARLRGTVTVVADETVGKRGARLTVTLRDGTTLDHLVSANRGTPDNPLSDDDLNAKLRSIAVPRLGVQAANEVLAECWDCDLTPRASDVLRPFRHPD